MLSSIHPLGERARHNRWGMTVGAFTVGAVMAGAVVGLVLGTAGTIIEGLGPTSLAVATALSAIAAGALDLVGAKPPGPARQVNETWIGAFRGWVYGGAFGLELGVGFITYVVTWGVYTTLLAAMLTTSPLQGALVGATFGLGRSLSLLVAGFVDRPSRLTSLSRRLAKAGPIVVRASAVAFTVFGVAALAGGLL